ncbi:uncharacterized protein LOC111137611 isoform X1 [Crassostrea virginica]
MSLSVRIILFFVVLSEKPVCITSNEEGKLGNCTNGSGKETCCPNYYFQGQNCIACPPGWYGINCSDSCPSGWFGSACAQSCEICKTHCDPVLGCEPKNGNVTTSFNIQPEYLIAIFAISGSILFIAIFTATCIACFRVKARKNLWKPRTSSRAGFVAEKEKMKNSPGSCCDVKNRSSSTRLPCKNCAMNPTGKVNVKVSGLPSEHSSNVKVSDMPPEKAACYRQDQGESSNHLYSTIGNVDVYETPVNNTTVAVSSTGKNKDFNHNPLEIDEKYIMVTKSGASIGLEIHNTAPLASFKPETILEDVPYYATANYHQNTLFTENLPPPRL